MTKVDPIRENFFKPYEQAEAISGILFYGAAVVSFSTLFLSKQAYPSVGEALQVVALLAAIALFVLGLAIRLYLMPRAEDQRLSDFFGQGFNVDLGGERTQGYYNNDLHQPMRRLAAQVLENALFSRAITRRMSHGERWRAGICVLLLIICIAFKRSEYDLMIATTQIVLSEHILSKFIRLEWLRCKCEDAYRCAWDLLSSPPPEPVFSARVLAAIGAYEAAKANAGVLFDSKVFNALGSTLEEEWGTVRTRLGIARQP